MRSPQEIILDYKAWLIEQVAGYDLEEFKDVYHDVLEVLWLEDYEPRWEMDENRAMDGKYLRKKYDITFHPRNFSVEEWLEDSPCCVLEMLVALSVRVYNEFLSSCDIKHASPHTIFMENLRTIGLKPRVSFAKARKKVTQFCENGVCFRVKNAQDVEIWWQVQYWLDEKYPL